MAQRPPCGRGAGETFPGRFRIRATADFTQVLTRGRRLTGTLVAVYVRAGVSSESRLGVALSRRLGGAVVRNRLRRRVRELFRRRLRAALDERHGPVDVIVRPFPPAARATVVDLEIELTSLLARWSPKRHTRSNDTPP